MTTRKTIGSRLSFSIGSKNGFWAPTTIALNLFSRLGGLSQRRVEGYSRMNSPESGKNSASRPPKPDKRMTADGAARF